MTLQRVPASVTQLGYVGMNVSDMGWWRQLADTIGAQVEQEPEGARPMFLRLDGERIYRLALHAGDPSDFGYLGWEVSGAEALAEVGRRLAEVGATVTRAEPALIAERMVEDMLVVRDPDGLRNEIYWGATAAPRKPFRSPQGIGFGAGATGFGHVTFAVSDAAATQDFYMRGLGMRMSDVAWMEGNSRVYFLRCNARHHTYAFAVTPEKARRALHVMIDVKTMEDLGEIRDRLLASPTLAISRDVGKHVLCGVVSLYVRTPEGRELEIGSGTYVVNEATWEADKYLRANRPWGHKAPPPKRGTST